MNLKIITACFGTLFFIQTSLADGVVESHTSGNIDPNQPIASLENLTSVPASGDTKPLAFTPTIASFTTTQGTPVLFVAAKQLPILDVRLTFNAGSARDEFVRKGAYGVANLTANMLFKGTTNLTEDEISEQIEQYGLSLTSQSYKDMFVVSYRSLSPSVAGGKYADKALALTSEILANADFPIEALERTRAQSLVGLKQALEKPAVLANNAFMQALYGDHPYAHPTSGTLTSLPTLTQEDLNAFKNRFLVAQNASLAITGDIDLTEAKALAERLTAALPAGTPAPALPTPKTPQAAHIHVPFDSSQTTIIMGQLGITRSEPKQYDLTVANDIFGGGEFHARLMNELREKRGLTYGAYAGFSPMQTIGPYTLSYSTRNDKLTEALTVTKQTLRDFAAKGATAKEVADTKTSQINQFPLSLASNSAINGWLGMMAFYELPTSYISNHTDKLNKVTTQSANAAFSAHIHPDEMILVTVGPQNPQEK